jgi:hypothetical protein
MNRPALAFCLCLLFAANFCLVGPLYGQDREAIQEVVLHPIMNDTFVCAEHAEGELTRLGDALGKDCMVIDMDSTRAPDKRLLSLSEGKGLNNEDWFGWEAPLLAPCDGTVDSTRAPARTNRPGEILSDAAPGQLRFTCQDGVRVVYAHVRNIQVQSGDSITAGEAVAEIGNNGNSDAPHVHLGAWKGETPFQIRFDLRALGELRNPETRSVIDVDSSTVAAYTGIYALSPDKEIIVSQEGDQLFIEVPGQQAIPLLPNSRTKFFPKGSEASVTFERDADGHVTHLIIHQDGEQTRAPLQSR